MRRQQQSHLRRDRLVAAGRARDQRLAGRGSPSISTAASNTASTRDQNSGSATDLLGRQSDGRGGSDPSSARYSQARAKVQCRLTVAGEMPSTSAGLLDGEPGEVTQLGDLRLVRRHRGEPLEGLVDVLEVEPQVDRRFEDRVQRHRVRLRAAALRRLPPPGVVDQDPPHRLRRRAVEVPAVLQPHLPDAFEPQVGLVDQGRRLERVVGPLVAQQPAGELTQLAVHQLHQRRERRRVARVPPIEPAGHISHTWRNRLGL